ncbi:MAG: hypothetical protein OEZ34_12465, partial [Spirochaetia bacterium]|nr:hypothetical protein [Spirochaetia bacterium]
MRAGCTDRFYRVEFFNQLKSLFLCLTIFVSLYKSASCSHPSSSILLYQDLVQKHQSLFADDSALSAESGSLKVSSGSFLYSLPDGRIYDFKEIKSLTLNVQKVLLEKAILRKMAVSDGIQKNIYQGPDFEKYFLARQEKILEEYYYLQMSRSGKGNHESIRNLLNQNHPIEVHYESKQ